MDKSVVNQFTSYVEQLRNTECSQKEKIACFQHIAECIMSPGLAGHINYATHINMATTVLLLFCEDLDPVVRMNAEENLNRIFRALEKSRVSRILMDLYGEIKRNGNQRSLRICLNLFSYYAPQIRERNIKWYAVRLLPCLQTIAQRKETQLCETLCEFVKSFGKCLQMGLTDTESCKLFEAFMANIGVECAVKRRCSAQNCISLIENSRNKSLMAKHGLSKACEFLLSGQQQHNVLGVLGFLRLLLPLIIHGFRTDCPDDCDDGHSPQTHVGINKSKAKSSINTGTQRLHTRAHTHTNTTKVGGSNAPTSSAAINTECRQIIEIFDYCLHLLNISSASQHSIINAALEVINAVLQALDVANNSSSSSSSSNSHGNNNNNSKNSSNNKHDLVKSLQAALCNQQLQHTEYLRRRKSLKNQIFQLRNYEVSATVPSGKMAPSATAAVKSELPTATWQKRSGGAADKLITALAGAAVDSEGEASESMSKLFRPSSAARATPTKSAPTPTSEKVDVVSTILVAASGTAPIDSISLISTTSSGNKVQDSSISAGADPLSDSAHTYTQSNASSSLGMHDDTVSTALLVDTSLHSAGEIDTEMGGQSEKNEMERRIPNVNPFLNEKSQLQQAAPLQPLLTLKIGTLFEQSIIRYTARLIAARFLLTGQANGLHNDIQIRISIKSLSLSVLAQCMSVDPEVLQLPLEISERELLELRKQSPVRNAAGNTQSSSKSSSASGSPSMPQSDDSGSGYSSNLGKDYEHLDAVDFVKNNPVIVDTATVGVNDLPAALQLLEIKDDHFGKSTCDYFLHSTPTELSKSADPVLMSQQVRCTPSKTAKQQQQMEILSKSEIIESKAQRRQHQHQQQQREQRKQSQPLPSAYQVTESVEDTPPQMLPPRPPKRTKSQRKSIAAATATVAALMQIDEHMSGRLLPAVPAQHQQQLTDVLLYYNHTDPMLRGGVQQIIGGFLRAVGGKNANIRLELNVQHLLAMLVRGLQDEIHTVVIQALNAFEKIFPYVVYKYLILPTAHQRHKQQQQQQQRDTASSKSSIAGYVEAVDKSGRKCHANAAGQVPQQQQQQHKTNDETNFGFYTHASSKLPAMGKSATTAKTCPRTLFNDNDELIAALLNDFQLQSKLNRNGYDCDYDYDNANDTTQPQTGMTGNTTSSTHPLPVAAFRISPKLLLSKLRLCHYNKYWLVQNKYAEVISNLNYAALHAACNDCHGYCCGTAIGCECGIATVVANAREKVGNANGRSGDFNTDNNAVEAALPASPNATKDDALASSATSDTEDVSYSDLNDSACIYESQFLDELLQLIGDDDFRVREHAALCLCRFIIQNAKRQQQAHYKSNNNAFSSTVLTGATTSTNKIGNQYPDAGPFSSTGDGVGVGVGVTGAAAVGDDKSLSSATYETNFNLLWDFFDYRLFSGLPLPLRNLFRAMSTPSLQATTATEVTATAAITAVDAGIDFSDALPQRHQAEEEKLLAKVLYRMTNKLMELEDKNAQFGIIYTLKMLLQDFNFIDYQRAWMEFNFIEICQRFSYYNYSTAVDLGCQNDLIDVTGKLMAGYILASTLTSDQPVRSLQLQLDQLLVHVMKILNIYYHLITQQKPQLFVKVQKGDLFANAKELALVQSVGYFGSDFMYIKLYNILRSANDSYKITINQESGRLLISLLRTCLNTLSLCIELRTHATPVATAGTPTGQTPSHSKQRGNSPGGDGGGGGAGGSSRSDTSPSAGHTFGGSTSGASAVFPSNAILKLIEEILQYLSKLVNYAPAECIACLRQLLKYLFGQNYGNQQRDYYATFIRPYFVVRSKAQQLQLHPNQQRSPQQQQQQTQKWPTYNKQQHPAAQQGTQGGGSINSSSNDHRQALTMLHAINSKATTATLAFTTATGVVRSVATIGGPASTLRGAAGDGLPTPTMTSSTVTHNEPNVIGAQATYAKHGQAHTDFGHATVMTAASGGINNQPHLTVAEYYRLMGELFSSGLNLQAWKSERASESVRHIKLFEPLVIYCLMLFLKSSARVQAPILELLSQLLELNVTYSVLDSKNVIFDQILNNLDLIENGIVRNGSLIIPPMIKFLIQLTHKSDRKLITIPKIISITNSLLANNAVLGCAVLALKSLSYEIFFMPPVGGSAALTTLADYRAPFQSPVTRSPVQQRRHPAEDAAAAAAAAEALLANSRELDTQKEVVLGMLEKFVDANELQRVVALLLLRERSVQQLDEAALARRVEGVVAEVERQKVGSAFESTLLQDPNVVYALVCRAMCDGRLDVANWQEFHMLESCFKNYSKYVLADSKNFLMLLKLVLAEDVENFSALAHTTIILANVILKTEEIYLVNHIKLYLKNHPAVEERERERSRNQQQQQRHQRTAHWLLDDGPSTSSAAARAAATASSTGLGGPASSGSISEINYFAKVLCEKLENCLDTVTTNATTSSACGDVAYYQLACRFVAALHEVCCLSRHKDALQSVFRLVLAESALLDKYCNFLTMVQLQRSDEERDDGNTAVMEGFVVGGSVDVSSSSPSSTQAVQLQLEVLKLLSAMKLLDPVVMLQMLKQQKHCVQRQQLQQPHKWQVAANKERLKWCANMQRTLLSEICQQNPDARNWTVQQVRQLLDVGGAAVVNFLITENFVFVSDLCEMAAAAATASATTTTTKAQAPVDVASELGALWLRVLLQHANALNKHAIRALPPLLLRLCNTAISGIAAQECNLEFTLLSLQLLKRLHARSGTRARALQVRLERLARRLVINCSMAPLKRPQLLRQLTELAGEQSSVETGSSTTFWQQLLLDTQECTPAVAQPLAEQQQQRIIDEKWLLSQLIKFSAQSDYGAQHLSRILLEIQSEQKLCKIFSNSEFAVARVLRHAIASSMQTMLATFRNNCIQHNPHIHYMQPNPLVRVTCTVLVTRISAKIAADSKSNQNIAPIMPTILATQGAGLSSERTGIETGECLSDDGGGGLYLCNAVATFLECIKKVEHDALLYIESKFIDKFVREQLLRPEHVATLLGFLDWCCGRVQQLLQQRHQHLHRVHSQNTRTLLQCIGALLQQRFIWTELNQMEKPTAAPISPTTTAATAVINTATFGSLLSVQQRNLLLCRVLDVLVLAARQTLQHTIFYKHYKQAFGAGVSSRGGADDEKSIQSEAQDIFNNLGTSAAAAELKSALQTGNQPEVSDDAVGRLLQAYAPQAVFIAKLIELHAEESTIGVERLSTAYLSGSAGKGSALSGGGGGAMGGGGGSSIGMATGCASTLGGAAGSCAQAEFESGRGADGAQIPMPILAAIGVAVLRTNQFYAYAVTPFEIYQQQQREQRIEQLSPAKRAGQASKATSSSSAPVAAASGKLPTIPVESLSDVDVLRKFVKRLSIFGFTTRQQFEEYFMTFLLLINKVYDENMVDEQEQFQIRSTCLEAILELLITYKTFPIVGNKLSHFHHTTRWTRINCNSISLKKLHKVQLLASEATVFYHPNLERQLRANCSARLRDTVIGTSQFRVNQYDLNFMWQQMEAYAQNVTSNNASDTELSSGDVGVTERRTQDIAGGAARLNEDTATKNYRYFTAQSGVDFKSSTQLIFDVLMQIIEHNHILVLPNLVKFTEICESRDQIRWIKEKALKLQETIPMDDTISHQHLIYLLCKTQAMLIPTIGELQQLCQLIGNYLKSSHIFIRNATLAGLLCLLECCSKTNTSIGKLSEELALLRELIVSYINRHGIIDVSTMQNSDTHTKLVWALNYCLIEWTSKFVPQCHLLSNTVIAAGNFLRKTSNEDVYLSVLHGLERIVVISNTGNGSTNTGNNPAGISGVGIVTPLLRNKIEKLALELIKLENERFSIPALQLLLSCMYVGSAKQLENTELSNGIVQDEPEIIAQQTDKVDILLHCIKSSTRDAAWIYGQVLCQIIRDLVPPNEILTKVIKEFLAINQPHCDVIAMIVYQVFRCAIDSTFLQMLQDWLICSLPTFLALPEQKGVWCLSVIFLSASINLHLIKLFPVLLSTGASAAAAAEAAAAVPSTEADAGAGGGDGGTNAVGAGGLAIAVGGVGGEFHKLGQHEIALFVTAATDFHAKLSAEQRMRFRDAFEKFHRQPVYAKLLQSL